MFDHLFETASIYCAINSSCSFVWRQWEDLRVILLWFLVLGKNNPTWYKMYKAGKKLVWEFSLKSQ